MAPHIWQRNLQHRTPAAQLCGAALRPSPPGLGATAFLAASAATATRQRLEEEGSVCQGSQAGAHQRQARQPLLGPVGVLLVRDRQGMYER